MTFLNGLFLFGLFAGLVPILIHLLARRRAAKRDFPSLDFLNEILFRKIQRARLRQLLLLLLRVLAVCALAVALARPAIGLLGGSVSSGSTAMAIILDNSLSMNARWKSESTFRKATRIAKKIGATLGRGDEAYVVTGSYPAMSMSRFPMGGATLVQRKIDEVSSGHTTHDIGAAYAVATELVMQSDKLNREIFVVSDFQEGVIRQLQDAFPGEEDDSPIRTFLCPAGRSMPNAAVLEATVAAHDDPTSQELRVLCTVYNSRPGVSAPFPVWLYQEETVVGEVFADVPPGTNKTLEIPGANVERQIIDGRIEVASDALDGDNKRYILWTQPEPVKVLVIKGDRKNSLPFVETALNLTRVGFRPIEADVEVVEDIAGLPISEYAVVVITEVERLPLTALIKLKDFLSAGGGMVVLLDAGADLRYYNDNLIAELMGARITGFWDGGESYTRLKQKDFGHQVFSGFTVPPGEAISEAMFYKAVEVTGGDSVRVLAEFSNGLPAILESGRVILYTSGVDLNWNTLPVSGAFLPLLHQSVVYLAGQRVRETNYLTVGDALSVEVDSLRLNAPVTQVDPWGHETEVTVDPGEVGFVLQGEPVERPGFYIWRNGEQVLRTFVANVSPEESVIEAPDISVLEDLGGGSTFVLPHEERITAELRDVRIGKPIWRELLLLSALCLVAEGVLSRNRGRI
jgi:hypothetical protein